MFRRRRERAEEQPPGSPLPPAWQQRIADMEASRQRFAGLVDAAPAGPLRDRLAAMLPELDAALQAAVDTARRAGAAAEVARSLDVGAATDALKEARRRLALVGDAPRADTEPLAAEVERLAAHHAAVNRALNAVEDADRRVEVLALRLRTAVAEAAALLVAPVLGDGLDRLDAELRDVHARLDALNQAFAELAPGA